jgi:predicted transposase/invertase (TIGR01784 family)
MESLSRVTQSDRDYNHYMSRLKYEMDQTTELHYAEKKGKAEGKSENAIETAIRLLQMGLAPFVVSQGTTLPLADIEELQKKL